ncbi:hypothetical protein ACIRO1_36450 [Streptomyces sp. NPDC102381]|uniref:hypothetical protein n=1 Tax=Streptomyces sp. NPDC102381 TaxID=3366164 RepID=UPI0037FBB3A3
MRKLIFPAAIVATVATSVGLGTLSFSDEAAKPSPPPTRVDKTVPERTTAPTTAPAGNHVEPAEVTSSPAPTTPTQAPTTEPVTATQAPSSTPTKAKHAKARTTPEKHSRKVQKGKHTKPKKAQPAKTEPGSKGPFKDAEGDGKVLDDWGKLVAPKLPHVPDHYLPFPGGGDGRPPYSGDTNENLSDDNTTTYPYDPNWGDDEEHAADPGIVCDPEMAAYLGVPVSDSCSSGSDGPADTWGPVIELPGGISRVF